MDIHGQIMNLPTNIPRAWASRALGEAYRDGCRDTRHAAAEVALNADERLAAMEDLRKEVERCFDIAQALDATNPTLAGAFTGTPSERIQRQLDAMAGTL